MQQQKQIAVVAQCCEVLCCSGAEVMWSGCVQGVQQEPVAALGWCYG